MSVFVVLFLPITLGLGAWQVERAQEQSSALAELERNKARIVSPENDGLKLSALPAGTGVRFCAAFTGATWYLDNRTHEGKVGYDLYWPARLCSQNQAILVRRGWVIARADRTELPVTRTPPETAELSGRIRPRPTSPFLSSGPEFMGQDQWRLQSLEQTPQPEYGEAGTAIVQVTRPRAYGLVDDWSPARLPPSRHLGYAVQWFGLSLVLLLGYLYWGWRRAKVFNEFNATHDSQGKSDDWTTP